jgi:hypothetical protein
VAPISRKGLLFIGEPVLRGRLLQSNSPRPKAHGLRSQSGRKEGGHEHRIAPENQRLSPFDGFREQAHRFFEVQLERLRLGETQIANQGITELEDSLARVDDALRTPESFGVLRISVSGNATVFIVKSDTGAHIEVGAVPLLLERKKAIVDRLRLLRSQRPIKTI